MKRDLNKLKEEIYQFAPKRQKTLEIFLEKIIPGILIDVEEDKLLKGEEYLFRYPLKEQDKIFYSHEKISASEIEKLKNGDMFIKEKLLGTPPIKMTNLIPIKKEIDEIRNCMEGNRREKLKAIGKKYKIIEVDYSGIEFTVIGENNLTATINWCDQKYKDKLVDLYAVFPIMIHRERVNKEIVWRGYK